MASKPEEGHCAYYFAYGSNLNPYRMKERKVIFTKRELAILPEYEFLLNKLKSDGTAAANIRPCEGKTVYGALYTCAPCVFEKLDVFEGVSTGHYSREKVKVKVRDDVTKCDVTREVVTYIATGASCDDSLRVVTRDYLEHVLCGRDLFPREYTEFLESFSSWCP